MYGEWKVETLALSVLSIAGSKLRLFIVLLEIRCWCLGTGLGIGQPGVSYYGACWCGNESFPNSWVRWSSRCCCCCCCCCNFHCGAATSCRFPTLFCILGWNRVVTPVCVWRLSASPRKLVGRTRPRRTPTIRDSNAVFASSFLSNLMKTSRSMTEIMKQAPIHSIWKPRSSSEPSWRKCYKWIWSGEARASTGYISSSKSWNSNFLFVV